MSLKLSFFYHRCQFSFIFLFQENISKIILIELLNCSICYIKVQSRVIHPDVKKKIKFDYLDQYNNSLWHLFLTQERR